MNGAASIAITVGASLGAAGSFGLGAVLQYRQARQASGDGAVRLGLLADLLSRPLWLAGMAAAAVGYALQGIALAFGPLALVAPIVATDLLFALPLAAWWSRRVLSGRDWTGCLLVAGGVGIFLASSPPSAGLSNAPRVGWLTAFGAAALVTAAAVVVGRRLGGAARATLLGGVAGLIFGLLAAVTLTFSRIVRQSGPTGVLAHWQPWALVALGITGVLLSQAAYQAGTLNASLPVIDALEPISAVLIGTLLFGERLAASPAALAVQLAAAAVATVGITMLNPSSLAAPRAQRPAREPAGRPAHDPHRTRT